MKLKESVIYLDYDGVLHNNLDLRRYLYGDKAKHRDKLFYWSNILEEMLTGHDDIGIVLSTSWVERIGYDNAKDLLPSGLKSKVIGATFHSEMSEKNYEINQWWKGLYRYDEIESDLIRRKPKYWLSIDDDDYLWNSKLLNHLTPIGDSELGISSEEIQSKINDFINNREKYSLDISKFRDMDLSSVGLSLPSPRQNRTYLRSLKKLTV